MATAPAGRLLLLLLLLVLATLAPSPVSALSPYRSSLRPRHPLPDEPDLAREQQRQFQNWLAQQRERVPVTDDLPHIPNDWFDRLPNLPSLGAPTTAGDKVQETPSSDPIPTPSASLPTGRPIPFPPTGPGIPPSPPRSPPNSIPWLDDEDEGDDGSIGRPPTRVASGRSDDVPAARPQMIKAAAGSPASSPASASAEQQLIKEPSPEFTALKASAAAPTADDRGALGEFGNINEKLRTINVYNTLGAIILIITGILFVFSGHHMFKLVLFIGGFYAGGLCSYIVLSAIENRGHSFGDSRDLLFFVITLVVGLAIGTLFVCIWKLGLVAVGAMLGFTIAMLVLSLATNGLISQGTGRTIFIIVLTVVGGIAVLFLERPILVVGTSVAGAFAIMWGVDVFTKAGLVEATRQFLAGNGTYQPTTWVYVELGGIVLIALVGILVQWRGLRAKERRHTDGGSSKMHAARSVGSSSKSTNPERTKLVAEFEKIVVRKP